MAVALDLLPAEAEGVQEVRARWVRLKVIETNPHLDRERIERWVREFAQALDMPELWEDIAGWLCDAG